MYVDTVRIYYRQCPFAVGATCRSKRPESAAKVGVLARLPPPPVRRPQSPRTRRGWRGREHPDPSTWAERGAERGCLALGIVFGLAVLRAARRGRLAPPEQDREGAEPDSLHGREPSGRGIEQRRQTQECRVFASLGPCTPARTLCHKKRADGRGADGRPRAPPRSFLLRFACRRPPRCGERFGPALETRRLGRSVRLDRTPSRRLHRKERGPRG